MTAFDARNTANLVHTEDQIFSKALLHDIYLAASKGQYFITRDKMHSSDRYKFIFLQKLGYSIVEECDTGPFGELYTTFKIFW